MYAASIQQSEPLTEGAKVAQDLGVTDLSGHDWECKNDRMRMTGARTEVGLKRAIQAGIDPNVAVDAIRGKNEEIPDIINSLIEEKKPKASTQEEYTSALSGYCEARGIKPEDLPVSTRWFLDR